MIKTYDQLDKETKKAIMDTLGLLLTEGIRSILEVKRPEQWRDKWPKLQRSRLGELTNKGKVEDKK